MITLLLGALAAAASPDSVLGRWRAETRNAVVEVARCGRSICGRLIASDGLHANPDMRDANNHDPSLRDRPLRGLMLLSGFSFADGAWYGGTIYNAEDGRTYGARITAVDRDHLKLRGCVFVPFCKTQTWVRVR